MMRRFLNCSLTILMLLNISGCMAMALGGVAAAGGTYAYYKYLQAGTEKQRAYDSYVANMNRINLERIQAGLPELPVETFEQWEK